MALIQLHTQGKVAIVDDADLPLVESYKWYWLRVGRDQYIEYAYHHHGTTRTYMHRLLCPGQEVDHRNGDGLDNRRENLRPTTHRLNLANQRKQVRPTSSRFKGVSWYRQGQRWEAYIKINGRKINLGHFNDELQAARTYNAAALAAWGEFARLNEVG